MKKYGGYQTFMVTLLVTALGYGVLALASRADLKPVSLASTPESTSSAIVAEVEGLAQVYNLRFNAQGRRTESEKDLQNFIQYQREVIQELKQDGVVQPLILALNSKSDTVLRLSAIVKEADDKNAGELVALLFEKSKYSDPEDQSVLRVRPTRNLHLGETLLSMDGKSALRIRSLNMDSTQGGTLDVEITTDLKAGKFTKLKLSLVRDADSKWSLIDTKNQKKMTKLFVKVWINIFTLNGGAKEILTDSRNNLPKDARF